MNFKIVKTGPWQVGDYLISIAEEVSVSKELDRLLNETEHQELIDFLAFNPETGDVMPGTGGIRKMRWGFAKKGKSTGLRVIYYFRDLNMPLYVLATYSKGETLKLTKREEREMEKLVNVLVQEHCMRRDARLAEHDRHA